jgi:hypothetical protein
LIPIAVTTPPPVPLLATISVNEFTLKVAVQVRFPLTVTVPVVLQPVPDQPANDDPLEAVAVSVTELPLV